MWKNLFLSQINIKKSQSYKAEGGLLRLLKPKPHLSDFGKRLKTNVTVDGNSYLIFYISSLGEKKFQSSFLENFTGESRSSFNFSSSNLT